MGTTPLTPGLAPSPGSDGTGVVEMYAGDRASQALGIVVEDFGEDWARCSMTVGPDMANGHGITHGGYLFLFADTTFAMACNTEGSVTVASGGDITFLRPSHVGDALTAEGRAVATTGRSGVYDITVRRGDEVIAVYRGRSRTLPARPAPPAAG
ncbi:hydroxyphenylacetyl-CoA thioesterase PaaI [Brevibacterium sp. 5221]|uniref:Hydroxyphenylacetyl-CoA thioesterase PaaI n=1 Tax=Brevibacterium rongguiense TaxID=2695267 RepID=A0A6N9H6Q9_9MICO|nr:MULTISPECIES: hydroxyphenylacetyl-CoA thioesterase PaaI [Brevibacterium]MYM19730.1 hydroxyphenylacetyl-CoA thioesterase PaaI [Brevibacterium rongguiense]WAL39707.1 hydroxyphenylacetyl-CoA thioesterase PaaI [Brevibacterium sp. BRM-1]